MTPTLYTPPELARKSKYTIVMDSSQIALFLECPMQWYFAYIKHLVPQRVETDDEVKALNAGSYGHKVLDIYYKARARGLSLNDATALALSYNPDTDTCQCGCSVEAHVLIPAFKVQECHRCKKCWSFKAKPYSLDLTTRMQVLNRVREYIYLYQANDIIPISETFVEVGFSEVIYEDSEHLFVLEGRMDIIGKLQGIPCIMDHKFQLSRHYLYDKTIQAKNYSLIAKQTMFVYNYIRLAQKIDKTTLQRTITNFSVPELLAWKTKLIEIFFKVKQAHATGIYEQRWNACGGKYKTYDIAFNKFCRYTTLCEEPSNEIMVRKEQALYKIDSNPWKPW